MTIVRRIFVLAGLAIVLGAPLAHAQTTGSITGIVTDASGAMLPGVTITLSGERLIGGPQTQVSDTSGTYRFDRLVPGNYDVKFELQGFRNVERPDVRISAAFVATINAKMEVGSLSETITVTGESPTVDVRSNVQQTVMNQEILEGIPTGRDPWSLAKLIPGVQVATYDVGGTQSMQQSSMSAHGSSTNDVSYNIDGATVNWPGGGGGATMIYYDQGMFEEVNYMTSAIPAEMLAGGVCINMVTKDGGNQWKGNAPLQLRQRRPAERQLLRNASSSCRRSAATRPTRPTTSTVTAAARSSRTSCGSTAPSASGSSTSSSTPPTPTASQALDDNDLKNYSGKVVYAAVGEPEADRQLLLEQQDPRPSPRQQRHHSRHRVAPCRPTRCRRRRPSTPAFAAAWCSSRTSASWTVRRTTLPAGHRSSVGSHHRHRHDRSLQRVRRAKMHQPNSRHQFDNVFTFGKSGLGRRAPAQGRRAVGPAVLLGRTIRCLNDHWLVYNNRRAGVGPHLQLAGVLGERRQGDRLLRAGFVLGR